MHRHLLDASLIIDQVQFGKGRLARPLKLRQLRYACSQSLCGSSHGGGHACPSVTVGSVGEAGRGRSSSFDPRLQRGRLAAGGPQPVSDLSESTHGRCLRGALFFFDLVSPGLGVLTFSVGLVAGLPGALVSLADLFTQTLHRPE